jgi:NhaA family Na+:H+ antiporter
MLLWINDALMAVFFLLVGLEVKRELVLGSLASRQRAAFPVIAALGGMVVPALLFLAFTWQDPWRATDGRSRPQRISPLRLACWRCWVAAFPWH